MEVAVRLDRTKGLAGQIYRQMRDAVLDGRLRRDEALPSSRELAEQPATSDCVPRWPVTCVEDDYDSEFRYTDQQLEPLHSLDHSGRVLYVGSFSKVLLPTLRLGFLLHPPSLRHALHAAKFLTDWHTNLPIQAAMADFLEQGMFTRHLRKVRRVYRQRHERIAAALAGPLSAHLTAVPSAAGLHMSAMVRGATADDALVRARAAGVGVASFPEIAAAAPDPPGVVFGYGMIDVRRIDEGLARLHRCLDTD